MRNVTVTGGAGSEGTAGKAPGWGAIAPTLALARRAADRAAYRAQQYAILAPLATARRLVSLATGDHGPDAAARAMLAQRYEDLLTRDLANVEAGLYPRGLLFQIPFASYVRTLPSLLLDIPRVLSRIRARATHDLPADVDVERYPKYFRRNFHWQTDGYLSRRSAELYDLAVELLFAGTSDVMRRQVIPPVSRYLAGAGEREVRLLDVACGTGRTLAQLAVAQPRLRLTGLDLSPYYLQEARRVLADVADVSLVAENAEHMPFRNAFFDVLTSVHLFHELPRPARRAVLAEMHRVLRPGGLLVIEDSAQLAESGELAFFLGRFAAEFHEPFYRDYVADDLVAGLSEAGFRVESVEPHFVAKVVVARKTAGARGPSRHAN
ncbi:MAG TPA: methyltransferase domain-containing protein [Candidatus Binatia bacterium]